MAKQNIKTKRGFTIIEVVLVLAIAGLIFLMVFVALPALQRSQKDAQRRNDMARLVTAVQNYQSNNKNKSPFTVDSDGNVSIDGDFVKDYLTIGDDAFNDPATGEQYTFKSDNFKNCTSSECSKPEKAVVGDIHVRTNAKCDGENVEYESGNARVAFIIKLEGAGSYCVSN